MKVTKRNNTEQDFCLNKIEKAINKANKATETKYQLNEKQAQKVIDKVLKKLEGFNIVSVDTIHNFVEEALSKTSYEVGKAYILYRDKKKREKKYSPIEEQALALLDGTSALRGDNANKKIDVNSSVRDYLAGLVCKSLAEKILPKSIIKGHKDKLYHFHDMDYSPVMKMHNCDLIDAEDMIENTFQMGDTLIEPNDETPFSTSCNLLAQINLQVSGSQYGGQTITWSHVLKSVDCTRKVIRKEVIEDFREEGIELSEERINAKVEAKLRKEVAKGVKTYQYQILCHHSSNGQTPFVSNNLCLREAETQQELDDMAMIIEEVFKRRIKGVKNESGYYISPLFPKLLYWTCDGLNVKEGDPYFYLTELAAECNAIRMQPDIMSEKQSRMVKEGQIIPTMGCRSLLAPIWEETEYDVNTQFYWVEAKEYPYGTFVDKKDFSSIPNGKYEKGVYSILFRGNTGWLIEKTNEKVVILKPKVYGRFNEGVVTINLPHVALTAKKEEKDFYEVLDERLEACRLALKERDKSVRSIKAKNSPILWMHGGLSRLSAEETVGELMDKYPQRASISLGYAGLFETCMTLIGKSNTTPEGQKLSLEVLAYMNKKCSEWKESDKLNYSIYGTPEESLTYAFAMANQRDFGVIPYITDKDYVVNSYHVDPREEIDAFTKLDIEGKFLQLSTGGAVSYVETADMTKNTKALVSLIQFMHEHILYAEINRKLGVCYKCGFQGDIPLTRTKDGNFEFTCPCCGNKKDSLMNIIARICGYIGNVMAGNTNRGRMYDIWARVIHLR